MQQHGPVTGYRFELYQDNEKELSGKIPGADAMEFTADCLKPDTQYKFRIAAINDAGTGVFSPFVEARTEIVDPESTRVSVDVASGRARYTCQTHV